MNDWFVKAEVSSLFPDLDVALTCRGREVSSDRMSRLVKVSSDDAAYYIKRYTSRGRWLRRYLGRSRLRAEWENLGTFAAMGLSAANPVAWGERRREGVYRGALVTREVVGARDLATLADGRHPIFRDRAWRLAVIRRLSGVVRVMHRNRFVHGDLKWRNILVNPGRDPEVCLIDCPLGRVMFWPLLTRGKIKDLACLDKVGKRQLSRTDRLRFYLAYGDKKRLAAADKREIRRILRFFEGRE